MSSQTRLLLSLALLFVTLYAPLGTGQRNETFGAQSQVGQVATTQSETLTEISILRNGDFENGLEGWTTVNKFDKATPSGNGYASLSTSTVHSGSSAAVLNYLAPLPGGSPGQPMSFTGICQSSSVTQMRGLRIQAWSNMRVSATRVAARLQVQIDGLTGNYYVAYLTSDQQYLRLFDNSTFKSIFLYSSVPGSSSGWLPIDQNTGADFQQLFGQPGQAVFQNDQSTVTICLQLMGFGTISGYQTILWDDVLATASIPVSTTSTTLLTATTSTETSTSESLQTSATISTEQTTTRQSQPIALVAGLGLETITALAAVIVIGLLAGVLIARRTKRAPAKVKTVYCINCGAVIRPDARFCGKCGSPQT